MPINEEELWGQAAAWIAVWRIPQGPMPLDMKAMAALMGARLRMCKLADLCRFGYVELRHTGDRRLTDALTLSSRARLRITINTRGLDEYRVDLGWRTTLGHEIGHIWLTTRLAGMEFKWLGSEAVEAFCERFGEELAAPIDALERFRDRDPAHVASRLNIEIQAAFNQLARHGMAPETYRDHEEVLCASCVVKEGDECDVCKPLRVDPWQVSPMNPHMQASPSLWDGRWREVFNSNKEVGE